MRALDIYVSALVTDMMRRFTSPEGSRIFLYSLVQNIKKLQVFHFPFTREFYFWREAPRAVPAPVTVGGECHTFEACDGTSRKSSSCTILHVSLAFDGLRYAVKQLLCVTELYQSFEARCNPRLLGTTF